MPSTSGDLLASVRERAHSNLFWRTLGVQVEDAREGWVRLRVPARDELRNAVGAPVHGGVLSALVDMAVGGALSTMHAGAAGGVGQSTPDLNASFLSPARGAGRPAGPIGWGPPRHTCSPPRPRSSTPPKGPPRGPKDLLPPADAEGHHGRVPRH